MSKVLVNNSSLADIAAAIREKNESDTKYKPAEMGAAIREIESGGGDFVGINFIERNEYYERPTAIDLSSIDATKLPKGFTSATAFLFANENGNSNGGLYTALETVYMPNGLQHLGKGMFDYCSNLKNIYGDLTAIEQIQPQAFRGCLSLEKIPYMPNLTFVSVSAFEKCTALKSVNFYNTPVSGIHQTAFNNCTNLKDIYVPWSEGAVANAPWGATNATVHYNTTYDTQHNPII